MDIVERISFPGHKHNEDLIGSSLTAAWILDGSKGTLPKHYLHDDSDAIWYVEKWQHYLKENADNLERSLGEIIHDGLLKIKTAYTALVADPNLNLDSFPKASITIVRDLGTKVEYYILGSSVMLSFDKSAQVTCYKLDHQNQKPHFLSYDEQTPLFGQAGILTKTEHSGLFLASNGLSRAFTDYDFFSIEELYGFLLDKNLLDFYRLLRRTEKELKLVSEDASAMFIRF